jgi:hypothetical protein
MMENLWMDEEMDMVLKVLSSESNNNHQVMHLSIL